MKKLLPQCRVLCPEYPACALAGRPTALPSSIVVVWHAVDDRPCPPKLAAFACQVLGEPTFDASASPPCFAGSGKHRMGWTQFPLQDTR